VVARGELKLLLLLVVVVVMVVVRSYGGERIRTW